MPKSKLNNNLHDLCLKKGDTIGLAAPAGPIELNIFSAGTAMLQDAGLKLKYSKNILEKDNYLAGSDLRRVKELHTLWADQDVKAILSVRGGFGSSRIVSALDFDLIKKNPKLMIGFSDLTILLNSIYQQAGVVTFHGPMLSTIVRDGKDALNGLLNFLAKPNIETIKPKGLEVIRSGHAEGPLIGGNLASLIHLLSTPYEPDWQDAVLFIEDINEPSYRIDRMLTHLKSAGVLDRLAGIILGDFLDSELKIISDLELIWQRILDLTDSNIPVWANFPVGHGAVNNILPIGANCIMDSGGGILKFLY